jgi:hypothetical protein
MQIVLDLADEFKPVLDDLTLLLRVVQAKVEEIRPAPAPDYAAIERELAARTAAIETEFHGVLLRAVDLDVPRILVGSDVHRRVGRHATTLRDPLIFRLESRVFGRVGWQFIDVLANVRRESAWNPAEI